MGADFETRLDGLGLSKAGLGRRLGVGSPTVCRWKNDPPQYALAYLDALEAAVKLRRRFQAILDEVK